MRVSLSLRSTGVDISVRYSTHLDEARWNDSAISVGWIPDHTADEQEKGQVSSGRKRELTPRIGDLPRLDRLQPRDGRKPIREQIPSDHPHGNPTGQRYI